jgi:hypothetical protein
MRWRWLLLAVSVLVAFPVSARKKAGRKANKNTKEVEALLKANE